MIIGHFERHVSLVTRSGGPKDGTHPTHQHVYRFSVLRMLLKAHRHSSFTATRDSKPRAPELWDAATRAKQNARV